MSRVSLSRSPPVRSKVIAARDSNTGTSVSPGNSMTSRTATGNRAGSLSCRPNMRSRPRHHAIDVTASDLPKRLWAEDHLKTGLESKRASELAARALAPHRDVDDADHWPLS